MKSDNQIITLINGYHGLEVYTCGGDPLGVGHEAVGEVAAVGQVQAHDPVMGVE